MRARLGLLQVAFPVMTGAGGLENTVTFFVAGEVVKQPRGSVKLTLRLCAPTAFHNTLIEFVFAPDTIVPPDIDQLYDDLPGCVEYKEFVFRQAVELPEIIF